MPRCLSCYTLMIFSWFVMPMMHLRLCVTILFLLIVSKAWEKPNNFLVLRLFTYQNEESLFCHRLVQSRSFSPIYSDARCQWTIHSACSHSSHWKADPNIAIKCVEVENQDPKAITLFKSITLVYILVKVIIEYTTTTLDIVFNFLRCRLLRRLS